MASTPERQKECQLLKLPAEIRNAIYSYILIQPSGLSEDQLPKHLSDGTINPAPRRRFCANILLTCQQINAEASPIFYGQNTFSAHTSLLTTMPSLLLAIRPNAIKTPPVTALTVLSMIRRVHIVVRLDTDPRFDRDKLRESFSGMEELEIDVYQAMYGGCDYTVLHLFEDIRGVRRAAVTGSIGNGHYAAWLAKTMMSPIGSDVLAYLPDIRTQRWESWTHGNR